MTSPVEKKALIQLKYDTTAGWAAVGATKVLAKGEPGFEELTSGVVVMKSGNGVDVWNNLKYTISDLTDVARLNWGYDSTTNLFYYTPDLPPLAQRASFETINGQLVLTSASGVAGTFLTLSGAQAQFAPLTSVPQAYLDKFAARDAIPALYAAYMATLTSLATTQSNLSANSPYVFVIVDSVGKQAFAIANDGSVVGKFKLQAGSVNRTTLDSDLSGTMPSARPVGAVEPFVMQDRDGRVAWQIETDGRMTIPKPNLGAGKVTIDMLSPAVQGMIGDVTGSLSGYVWSIVDTAGRIALGIKTDGSVVGKFVPNPGSIPGSAFDAATQARLTPVGISTYDIPIGSGWRYVIVDKDGYACFGVRTDGTTFATVDKALNAVSASSMPPDPYVVDSITDGSGNRQLVGYSTGKTTTGDKVTLTTTGDNELVRATPDGFAIFRQTLAGVKKLFYIPVGGGTTYPAISEADEIDQWGDSLSQADGVEARLRVLTGKPVINYGIGSQKSPEIASRQGGYQSLLTVTGNAIPASGAVNVTALSLPVLLSTGDSTSGGSTARSITGWLAGVYGTLAKDTFNAYTFTRSAAGSSVACPAGTPFVSEPGQQKASKTQVLWTGRNDVSQGLTAQVVLDSTAAMVAYLKAYSKRFIVLSTTTATSEGSGTPNYIKIAQQINPGLLATYGDSYIDIRRYLIDSGLADAGITPTANDTACIAADTIPPSLMNTGGTGLDGRDTIHFNTTAQTLIGNQVYARMQQKGWY